MVCGRHHAISSCKSPPPTSVFSAHQEKVRARKPSPGKGGGKTRARGPADPTLCCGVGSQGARGAKTQADHTPVRKSQGSVSFIPLGADNVGQILKQSCGLRLWEEMLVERPGCCREELVPESHSATKWMWPSCGGSGGKSQGQSQSLGSPQHPSLSPIAGQSPSCLAKQTFFAGSGWGRGGAGTTVELGVVIGSSGGVLPA